MVLLPRTHTHVRRYMNLHLSREAAEAIYARADKRGSGSIEFDEFENALELLKSQVCDETLRNIGVSQTALVYIFLSSTAVLLMLLMFILVGILAFQIGGTLSSIVNSVLVAGTGLGLGAQDDGKQAKESDVDKEVSEVLENMKPDT